MCTSLAPSKNYLGALFGAWGSLHERLSLGFQQIAVCVYYKTVVDSKQVHSTTLGVQEGVTSSYPPGGEMQKHFFGDPPSIDNILRHFRFPTLREARIPVLDSSFHGH